MSGVEVLALVLVVVQVVLLVLRPRYEPAVRAQVARRRYDPQHSRVLDVLLLLLALAVAALVVLALRGS